MRKRLRNFALTCVAFGLLAGCASFSTNTFRTEQTAVNLAYGAYVGWTNYLAQFPGKVTPQQSNDVRQARMRFAATVLTAESLRSGYETNSALKPALEAALVTMIEQSSNIVWTIKFYQQP